MAYKLERFTDYSRVVLCLAEDAAVRMNHKTISVEHILVGMTQAAGVAGEILRGLGLGAEVVKTWFEKSYEDMPQNPDAKIELAASVKRMLETAVDEARRMSHTQISTGHLLLALLRLNPPIIEKTITYLEMNTVDLRTLAKMAMLDYTSLKDRPRPWQVNTTSAEKEKGAGTQTLWYRLTSRLMKLIGVEPMGVEENTSEPTDEPKLISYLRGLIRESSPNARFYNYIGKIYLDRKEYTAAEQAFSEAIGLQPELGFVYCNRGVARLNLKDDDGAISDFTETIHVKEYSYLGYVNRGWAYLGKLDYEHATADFEEAIRLKPDDITAYNGRASIFLSKRELDRAIAECDDILRRAPQNWLAHDNRGTARAHVGNLDGAEEDFREVMRQRPDSSRSHSNLGWLELLRKEYDKGIAYCNDAIRLDPQNGQAYYSRGSAKAANGDVSGAVADYHQSLALWKNIDTKLCEHIAHEMRSYLAQWGTATNPG